MEDKNISGQEGLQLIQQMIQVAREEHSENGDGWLIWGWLLFAASVASVVLGYLELWDGIELVWLGALAIGLVLYVLLHVRRPGRTKVRTYIQELMDRLGTGFFISLFVLIAASYMSKSGFAFGYYYVLYAFWMFIHGSAIRFRPLIIGAIVNWAAAIAIFIIKDFRYDMMVSAVAIAAGYLVPGYMLRAQYRKKMLL